MIQASSKQVTFDEFIAWYPENAHCFRNFSRVKFNS